MAVVSTQPVSTVRASAVLDAGRRAAGRLWARRTLTAQRRADLYVSRTPVAVIAG